MPAIVQKRRSISIHVKYAAELARRGCNQAHLVDALVNSALDRIDAGESPADLLRAVPVSKRTWLLAYGRCHKTKRPMREIFDEAINRALDAEGSP